MNKFDNLIFSLLLLIVTTSYAQITKKFKWPNGAKAAIALTYDDGLSSHITTVAPILEKYNFKASFYITASSPSIYEAMDQWKVLAAKGHELGNHTAYHPCQKSKEGMDWVKEYHNLDTYTLEQLAQEVSLTNTLLLAMDGKRTRTFAYPCAHYFVGGESYKNLIISQFIAGRDSSKEQKALPNPLDIDLYSIPSWAPNSHEGKDLIAYTQRIMDSETFSTITFHGIGTEYLSVSKEAHEELLLFLDAHRDEIWVTNFQEITEYIKSQKK